MNWMALWALSAVLLCTKPVLGKPGLHAVGSLGEAHYRDAGDMGGAAILPQIGFAIEYRTPWVSVSNTPTVGYYYGRPFLEDWMGIEIGWDMAWARPAFTGGFGVQTFNLKHFLSDGDEYRREQHVGFPQGIGFRLWLFRIFYAEWQGRYFQDGGVPWWKMEFGYKVL